MGNENVLHVTTGNWESEVLKSDKPVFVDFWAEWCGPCRMVGPVVEQIAQSYSDKIKVVKLNVDENPNVTARFGVRSIPTLLVFKGGQIVDKQVGALWFDSSGRPDAPFVSALAIACFPRRPAVRCFVSP